MTVLRGVGGVWTTWHSAAEEGYCRRSTEILRSVPSSAAMLASMGRMYVNHCTVYMIMHSNTTRLRKSFFKGK